MTKDPVELAQQLGITVALAKKLIQAENGQGDLRINGAGAKPVPWPDTQARS